MFAFVFRRIETKHTHLLAPINIFSVISRLINGLPLSNLSIVLHQLLCTRCRSLPLFLRQSRLYNTGLVVAEMQIQPWYSTNMRPAPHKLLPHSTSKRLIVFAERHTSECCHILHHGPASPSPGFSRRKCSVTSAVLSLLRT